MPYDLQKNNLSLSMLEDCGIHIGNIMTVFPHSQKLIIDDEIVNLTPTEFKLLLILVAEVNKPVAPEKFYDNLWDNKELNITSFTLKVHISNLRQKLRAASDDRINLVNIKNRGYCLTIPEF